MAFRYNKIVEQLQKEADNGEIATVDVVEWILGDKEMTKEFVQRVLEDDDNLWDEYLDKYIENVALTQEELEFERKRALQ